MIEIKFSGHTFRDLRLEIQEFAVAHLGFKPEEQPPFATSVMINAESTGGAGGTATAPERKKPGRRPGWTKTNHEAPKTQSAPPPIEVRNQSTPSPVPPPIETVKVPAPAVVSEQELFDAAPVAPITKEDATKKLVAVNDKYGIDRARECLTRFSAQKMSELKPEKFPDFVEYCNKLLAE